MCIEKLRQNVRQVWESSARRSTQSANETAADDMREFQLKPKKNKTMPRRRNIRTGGSW